MLHDKTRKLWNWESTNWKYSFKTPLHVTQELHHDTKNAWTSILMELGQRYWGARQVSQGNRGLARISGRIFTSCLQSRGGQFYETREAFGGSRSYIFSMPTEVVEFSWSLLLWNCYENRNKRVTLRCCHQLLKPWIQLEPCFFKFKIGANMMNRVRTKWLQKKCEVKL